MKTNPLPLKMESTYSDEKNPGRTSGHLAGDGSFRRKKVQRVLSIQA